MDQATSLIKLNLIDNHIPLVELTNKMKNGLKPSHIALVLLCIGIVMTMFSIAPRTIINLAGFLIPSFMATKRMINEQELHTQLPYFLVFASLMVFHGWLGTLFSFVPFFHTIYLFVVIALYHPDIQLAGLIWGVIERFI